MGQACSDVAPCPGDLFCLNRPGGTEGFCTVQCGDRFGCGDVAQCAVTIRASDICLMPCTSSLQCHGGPTCDTTLHLCTLGPSSVSPTPPVCAATAEPPRAPFGPVHPLSGQASGSVYSWEPSGALLADGTLLAGWANGNYLPDPVPIGRAIVRPDGGVTADLPFPGPVTSRNLDVAMASARAGAAMVWLAFNQTATDREADQRISFATTTDGVTWSAVGSANAPEDCLAGHGCVDKPMVITGPDVDNLANDVWYLFYTRYDTGLRVRRSTDFLQTLSTPVTVMVPGYGDATVSDDGVVHVVAAQGSGNTFGSTQSEVQYVRSTDGARTFSAPVRVNAANESVPWYFTNPQVEKDVQRNALYVAYLAGSAAADWDVMLAVSSDDGATFSHMKINDDDHCATHINPSLALDRTTGDVLLTWKDHRGGVGRLMYTRCATGGTGCTANGSVSDRPFTTFELGRWSPRWQGDYDTLVIDPTRRVLHALWSQTVVEHGSSVARIFHAQAALRTP